MLSILLKLNLDHPLSPLFPSFCVDRNYCSVNMILLIVSVINQVVMTVGQASSPLLTPPLTSTTYEVTTARQSMTPEVRNTGSGSKTILTRTTMRIPKTSSAVENTSNKPYTTMVRVRGAPIISVHPTNVTVPVGASATFSCKATGQPNPHLVIIKEDTNYTLPVFYADSDNGDIRGQSNPFLEQTIEPVSELDEG